MEALNRTLFLHLNAGVHPSLWTLVVASFLAEVAIGLIPLTLLFGWLRGTDSIRKVMLVAVASGVLAIVFNLSRRSLSVRHGGFRRTRDRQRAALQVGAYLAHRSDLPVDGGPASQAVRPVDQARLGAGMTEQTEVKCWRRVC